MRKIKILIPTFAAIFTAGIVLPIASCTRKPAVLATSVEITNKTPYIKLEGDKPQYKFEAKVLPDSTTDKKVQWELNYDGIEEQLKAEASIDQEGNVTFKTIGYVNIVVKTTDSSNKSDTYKAFCFSQSDIRYKQAYDFFNASWSEICGKTLAELKTKFNMSNDDSFVGFLRTIELNDMTHWVRVIGENHDTLSDGSAKSVLTFESYSVYSTNDRDTSVWNASGNNFDFTTTTLRANLEASAFPETLESKRTFKRDIYYQIKNNNQGLTLQKVKKSVATKTSGNPFTITDYDSYIFPLTANEMGLTSAGVKSEGTTYSYYTNTYVPFDDEPTTVQGRRIKKSWTKSEQEIDACKYWLASPCAKDGYISRACSVTRVGEGEFDTTMTIKTIFVSFAFCI